MSKSTKVLFADDPLRAEQAAEAALSSDIDIPGFDRLHFDKGTVIFGENDVADAAYLIVRGRVEIRKGLRSDQPQSLARLGRGDIFGELALFDGSPRMAEAYAESGVEVIRISREEFLNRLEATDAVMRAIVLYVVKRMRNSSNDLVRERDPEWNKWNTKV